MGRAPLIQYIRKLGGVPEEADSDAQLLQRICTIRDEEAFTELMQRHGRMVFNTCRRILGHQQDAEDAYQATFLVLYRKLDTIRDPRLLPGWLYRVAYRISLQKKARRRELLAREQKMGEAMAPETTPEPERNELLHVLHEEVDRLQDKYRAIIVLCDLEGKTRKEAARHLGCPEGTVAGRLARARTMLARRLLRRGFSAGVVGTILADGSVGANPSAEIMTATAKMALGQMVVSDGVAALVSVALRNGWRWKISILLALLLPLGAAGGGWFLLPDQPAASSPAKPSPVEVSNPQQLRPAQPVIDRQKILKEKATKAFAAINGRAEVVKADLGKDRGELQLDWHHGFGPKSVSQVKLIYTRKDRWLQIRIDFLKQGNERDVDPDKPIVLTRWPVELTIPIKTLPEIREAFQEYYRETIRASPP